MDKQKLRRKIFQLCVRLSAFLFFVLFDGQIPHRNLHRKIYQKIDQTIAQLEKKITVKIWKQGLAKNCN